LSSADVVARDACFAFSLSMVGIINAKVNGNKLGTRIVAATLSLKGVEAGSSESRHQQPAQKIYDHERQQLTVIRDVGGSQRADNGDPRPNLDAGVVQLSPLLGCNWSGCHHDRRNGEIRDTCILA
jgi:hypothetical protein